MEYNIKQGGGSSRTRCAKENHPQRITKSSHLCFNIEHDENQKPKQMKIMKITSKHPYMTKGGATNLDR